MFAVKELRDNTFGSITKDRGCSFRANGSQKVSYPLNFKRPCYIFATKSPLPYILGDTSITASYLIFKLICWTFLSITAIMKIITKSVDDGSQSWKHLIFLTNWGFYALTGTWTWDTVFVAKRFLGQIKNREERLLDSKWLKRGAKLSFFQVAMTYPLVLTITLAYFALLFDPVSTWTDPLRIYMDLATHAFQTVVAFMDLVLTSRPYYWTHFWPSLAFGLAYMLMTVIYDIGFQGTNAVGQPFIYKIVDYDSNPGKAFAVVFGVLLLDFAAHFVIWSVVKTRIIIWSSFYKQKRPEESDIGKSYDNKGLDC